MQGQKQKDDIKESDEAQQGARGEDALQRRRALTVFVPN